MEAKSIYIVPQYDDEILEIVSGTWLISGMLADDWSAEFGDAAIAFSANTDINTDIFEFVFKVKDNAEAGKSANVSCEIVIKTMEGKEEIPVTFTVTQGYVTVVAKECTHTSKTEVLSKSADCVNSGNNMYYVCDSCDQAFKADGVTETTVEAETIPALGHDWTDATCTAPKTCKICGATEGNTLGHSFTNYVSNNDATCTVEGTKTAKCDRCDVTDTVVDNGSAKGHDYVAATCTAPKTCKTCGATEGDALGHSFTNYVSNDDATCTADGTKTAKCDRCDETDTAADVGSAKGHSYATTWSKGEDGHWHECSACGDKTDFAAHDYGTEGDDCVICEYARNHVHRLTLVPATDATCTDSGNKAYYTCSGCENWFEDGSGAVVISDKSSVIIGALGHDLSVATCTEAAKCRREGCGHIEGSALGHGFTSYVSNNDATCTADGTKTAKCDRCDVTDTITGVGSAKGHDYADATCTAPKTCKVCGATEGDPLGHSFTNYVSNNDATCTADGTKTATCDRCDATDTVADAGSAKGHDYAEATCTAPKTCKVCGATDGEALGHSYATVWSKGEDGHWHECAACGDKVDFDAHDYGTEGDSCVICEYERSHVHRLTLVSGVDATCTTDGNKAYYTCSGCENWFEDGSGSIVISDKTSVVIGALGHDLSEATCTEAAVCQREGCGHIEGTALGHSFTNYVSNNDATCTADGTKTATCDRCDVTDTVADAGSAKGHDYSDATCTTPKICKVCGATDGEALGHSYATTWSKGEDGHWHECSACGDKTDFAAHDYGDGDKCVICEYERVHIHRLTLIPAVDATCTTDGNVAYYICSDCENWFEDASGSIVISDKTSMVIAALGHDMTDATCTEASYCQREGCDYTEGSALGHIDANADSKCDRCGTAVESGQPTTPDQPATDNPQTGDNSGVMMWVTLLMMSFAGMIVCFIFGKKRNMA